jgi:hypothetical protein
MMVEKAALEAASYLVWDERQPNLALRVRPSGSRTTFMCGWVAVELGRGFAPYWGVTHDQSLRQSRFAVQDARVKVTNCDRSKAPTLPFIATSF